MNVEPGPTEATIVLFRPVGQAELELIRATGFRAFPPRLDHQPVFYPVVNEQYAHEIARRWNTQEHSSGRVGFVTRFRVRASHVAKYPVRTVGSRLHQEYWVPAAELEEFNANIVGTIDVIAQYNAEQE